MEAPPAPQPGEPCVQPLQLAHVTGRMEAFSSFFIFSHLFSSYFILFLLFNQDFSLVFSSLSRSFSDFKSKKELISMADRFRACVATRERCELLLRSPGQEKLRHGFGDERVEESKLPRAP